MIIFHLFGIKKYSIGENYVKLFNKKIFYDSKFGLVDYQDILCHHKYLVSFCKFVKPNLFIDIGANVGYFSMLMRQLYPDAKIIAFEPINKTYRCIEANFKGDNNIELINKAVSSSNGVCRMKIYEDDSANSTIVDSDNLSLEKVYKQTLDDFLKNKNIEKIDLIKIDVETHEKDVLIGAKETLTKTNYILLEIRVLENNIYTFSELVSYLYSSKYNFQLVAYRNIPDKKEGKFYFGDFLFENILFKK